MFEGQPQSEIDALIKSDPEFKQLYQRHRTLDKRVADAEIGAAWAMPLSKARRLYGGFNQADELAARLAQHYGWPLLPRDTVFRRHHAPQSTLKSDERQRNVRHAFAVQSGLVKNCNLLLIDDVVTTGATLNELARVLKRAGAGRIFCWTLARAQMKIF